MNVFRLLVLTFGVILLTACSLSDATDLVKDKVEEFTADSNAVENIVENNSDGAAEAEEVDSNEADDVAKEHENSEEKTEISDGPTDLKGILEKAAAVAETVDSVALKGQSTNVTTAFGEEDTSEDIFTGELSMNQLAMHMHTESQGSSGIVESETYVTAEDGIYSSADGEWMHLTSGGFDHLMGMVTKSQLAFFTNHLDAFQLDEDSHSFIISTSGQGDEFEQLMYGYAMEDAGMESMADLFSQMTDYSGSYTYYFNKDTYQLEQLAFDTDMTINMFLGEMNVRSEGNIYYDDYNQIDVPAVPDDVKENAMEMGDIPGLEDLDLDDLDLEGLEDFNLEDFGF